MSSDMRATFGARVVSSDGQEIGTVDRLILDPASGDLKAVAVRQGLFLRHDIEVPIAALQAGEGGALRLAVPAAEAHAFQPFDEARYTAASESFAPRYAVPPANVLTPIDPIYGVTINEDAARAIEVSAEYGPALTADDLENAVVGEGSEVRSRDGDKVGDLHEVVFDAASGRPARFTLRRGLFHGERLALPAALIAGVDDGALTLTVTAAWLEAWFSIEPGMEVWSDDETVLGTVARRETDALVVAGPDGAATARVPIIAVEAVLERAVQLSARREARGDGGATGGVRPSP